MFCKSITLKIETKLNNLHWCRKFDMKDIYKIVNYDIKDVDLIPHPENFPISTDWVQFSTIMSPIQECKQYRKYIPLTSRKP